MDDVSPSNDVSMMDESINEENLPQPNSEEVADSATSEAIENPDDSLPSHPRIDEDFVRKELSLADLVSLMDEYKPLIPDSVTDYYLAKAGFNCEDVRIKRVLALAAQKFVADVASDALHYSKLRQQTGQGRKPNKKHVLTIEDLSLALSEYGINVKKPEYYA